jgi:transposase
MAQAADLLKPLYDLMAERVRASKVIWTDDTPVPVRDPTLPRTRTGRSWVYVGDDRLPGGA